MYQIYADGQLLYSPILAEDGYNVLQPRVSMQLNKAGSLTFVVPPNNPMYGRLQRLKSIVTVYQDGAEVFRGRILHDERDFYNRKSVYCEGELAFLLDSVQRPFEYQGDIPELFEQFVRNHNDQVETQKQFEVGQITVMDPNQYINRSNSKHSDTLEALEDKLIKTHGGYLRTRAEGGIRYLDYVADYGNISGQIIEFGRNLLDLSEYISAEDIATVLIPLGAEQEDGSRLTVESVNDGKDYIENQEGIALFGKIVKIQEWDDVTLPQNLLTKGQEYLREVIELSVSINIKAVDLHLVDVDTDSIRLGDYVRVVSAPHGLDRLFLCSAVKLDLVNPDQTEYTLGVALKGLTEKQIERQKTVTSNVDAVQSVSKSAMTAAEGAMEAAEQANEGVNAIGQTISQMPAQYVSRSDFETYQEDLATALAACARTTDLPTVPQNVSAFVNDVGYLTQHQDLSGYALRSEIPTVPSVVSAFTNDAGYLTQHQDLSRYALRSELAKLYQAEELITQGTDLDNLTAPGVYISRWSSVSATLINCPVTGGFRLETRQTNTGAGYLSQTIYPNANAALIFRREQSNGSWTGWYKFTGTAV